MTWYTFGGSVNDYVEVPDLGYVDSAQSGSTNTKRPPVGTLLLVQDVETQETSVSLTTLGGSPITSVETLAYGYVAFRADLGIPLIKVSADNGVNWKFLVAMEALTGGAEAANEAAAAAVSAAASAAAATAADARQKANTRLEVWATGDNYEGPYPTPLPTGYLAYTFVGWRDPGTLSSPKDDWLEPAS